jgi:hypothetical protein
MKVMNTNPRIAKFISSQQTEQSEMKKRVISLGKDLVKALNLEPGVDRLSRWMAHYIAEQIISAENATGDEKSEVEKRCFETVLKLWQHRSSLPNGRRPFETFESIFRALDRLDPENPRSFYFPHPHQRQPEADGVPDSQADDVQAWIDIALGIDGAARVLIESAFKQAAFNALDEKTITWLNKAFNLTNSDDLSVIVRLVSANQEDQNEDVLDERIRQEQEERLRARIEKLDAFSELSNSLREALISELEKISKDYPSETRNDID